MWWTLVTNLQTYPIKLEYYTQFYNLAHKSYCNSSYMDHNPRYEKQTMYLHRQQTIPIRYSSIGVILVFHIHSRRRNKINSADLILMGL